MGRIVFGYEADLARRRARGIDDQMRLDPALESAERRPQRLAGCVVAAYTDEDAARAKTGGIARDIAGAADHLFLAGDCDYRCGRFWGNARHFAVNEIVEHEVPDAKDGLLGCEPQCFFEREHAPTETDRPGRERR